jgi:DNA-binding transcriptional MocR family regulator
MDVMKASDIRELLKLTENRDIISMAGGLPAPELFPVDDLVAITERVLRTHGAQALQYSPTEGHGPLRTQLVERMNRLWGTRLTVDQLMITTGSQQGLDLVGKLFLDEGDEVLCESPTYIGAISAWNAFVPRWVEVPTDEFGMDIAALEERLDRCRHPKFIYVVPNFQNPSGRTWSLERRRRLIEVAQRREIPVLEDNPYGELRYDGVHLPALQALDDRGLVIGLGTFSKVFCPGLRLGWLTAAAPFFGKLVVIKQGADLHSSTLNQMQAAEYLATVDFDGRVGRIIEVYRERRDALAAALTREMPRGTRFTHPAGGLFLWVELPEGLDSRALLARALEHGVAFVPGDSCFPNGGHRNTLRLNFSNMPPARIEEGVRRIAAAARQLMAESGGPAGPVPAPRTWPSLEPDRVSP